MSREELSRDVQIVAADEQQYLTDSDGDVESLTGDDETFPTHSLRSRYDTPPAALCLRRDRNDMAEPDFFSPSTISISDEYDMIDDAETASLSSSDHDDVDEKDDRLSPVVDEAPFVAPRLYTRSDSLSGVDATSRAMRHDVHDSILSEDIETPRQSQWIVSEDVSVARPARDLLKLLRERPLFVTFLSSHADITDVEEDLIKQLACKLSGENIAVGSVRSVRLPHRPGEASSATEFVCRAGAIDMFITRLSRQYNGGFPEPRESRADLALIYTQEHQVSEPWFHAAVEYIRRGNLPSMVIFEEVTKPLHQFSISGLCNHTLFSKSAIEGATTDELIARINAVLSMADQEKPSFSVNHNGPAISPSKRVHSHLPALRSTSWLYSILAFVIAMVIPQILTNLSSSQPSISPRTLLSSAIQNHLNKTDLSAINITHLLSVQGSVERQGRSSNSWQSAFVIVQPNHVLVSIPRVSRWHRRLSVLSANANKSGVDIAHNLTELINGFYCIDIDTGDAYDTVNVTITIKPPLTNLSVEANFGKKPARFIDYQKMRTDLSVMATRDLVLVNQKANAIRKLVEADLRSSVTVARDVTEHMTDRLTTDVQAFSTKLMRDLQKMYGTGFGWICRASHETMDALDKTSVRPLQLRQAAKAYLQSRIRSVIPARLITSARQRVLKIASRIRSRREAKKNRRLPSNRLSKRKNKNKSRHRSQ